MFIIVFGTSGFGLIAARLAKDFPVPAEAVPRPTIVFQVVLRRSDAFGDQERLLYYHEQQHDGQFSGKSSSDSA